MDDALLHDLAVLTTHAEPTPALQLLARQGDVDGVVSMLVDDRRFTNDVVPTMLLEDLRFPSYLALPGGGWILKQTPFGAYYMNSPCKPDETSKVEPWWAPGTQVTVCNNSYHADVVDVGKLPGRPNAPGALCGSFWGKQDDCGCGRNLIHCERDQAMFEDMKASITAEVYDTVGHVVSSGDPVQSIYTTSETVRDWRAEMMYRRHEIATGRQSLKDDRADFAKPTWKPRSEAFPGMHAGILTATNIARFTDAPRGEMMTFFVMMTCSSADGAHVKAHDTLGIDTASIRIEVGGKDYLSHAPGCTNCHARMENSIPFFDAWRSVYRSIDIEPELHKTREGKIYLHDIDDLRATTTTTPAAFAKVVTAQPEFASCQADRIVKYIFSSEDPGRDLDTDLANMIASRKPAREVLKAALFAYIEHMTGRSATRPEPEYVDTGTPFDAAAVRTFDPTLTQALSVCEDCHTDQDTWIDRAIKTHQTTALHALRMADVVASGSMPRDSYLTVAQREALVTRLAQVAWADEASGRATADVLLGNQQPAQVHEFSTIINLFGGQPADEPWKVPEQFMKPGFSFLSPGTAATLGLEAVRVCRQRGKTPAEIEACVDKLIEGESYIRASSSPTPPPPASN